MKRVAMNETKKETVRFSMKPNPFFYALEVTWHMLFLFTALGGIALVFSPVLLTVYVPLGLTVFIVALVTARHLMFVVTDKRAIVRRSSGETTTDELSIAIETVTRIEITSFGATYGSVYLTHEEPSPRENSKDSMPGEPQPRSIRRAFVPIERADSIWILLSKWPSWFVFYSFKGFDEFANIISEQQDSVPNVKGDHDASTPFS